MTLLLLDTTFLIDAERGGIDLGDDQRHLGIAAEGARVVDHHRADAHDLVAQVGIEVDHGRIDCGDVVDSPQRYKTWKAPSPDPAGVGVGTTGAVGAGVAVVSAVGTGMGVGYESSIRR